MVTLVTRISPIQRNKYAYCPAVERLALYNGRTTQKRSAHNSLSIHLHSVKIKSQDQRQPTSRWQNRTDYKQCPPGKPISAAIIPL